MWTHWHLRMDISEKSHNQWLDRAGEGQSGVEAGASWQLALGVRITSSLGQSLSCFFPI